MMRQVPVNSPIRTRHPIIPGFKYEYRGLTAAPILSVKLLTVNPENGFAMPMWNRLNSLSFTTDEVAESTDRLVSIAYRWRAYWSVFIRRASSPERWDIGGGGGGC